jgi:lysophospholipase L1-like esterase
MTLTRLADKIRTYHPDVLLLLIGANDLSSAASIPTAVQSVQTLMAYAQNNVAHIMVGTLLPEIPGLQNAGAASLIKPFNMQLVPAVTRAGVSVVDLYSDIAMDVPDWISPYDGLHPTEAGYREMARVWFSAIQNAFELPPSTATITSRAIRPSTAGRGGTRY